MRDYNKILHSLDAEERKLFAERIHYLDKRIQPGVTKLSWTSGKTMLDFFVKEARKQCKEVKPKIPNQTASANNGTRSTDTHNLEY